MKSIVITYFLVLTFLAQSVAQQFQITTSKDLISIGEQLDMKVMLSAPSSAKVTLPLFQDTLNEHIEILSSGKVDTTIENGISTYTQVYKLTSFDSGYYAIPPQAAMIESDTIFSNAFLIAVQTFEIDTANQIFDIKPIAEVPLSFKEIFLKYWHWLAIAILILALITGIVYYMSKKKQVIVIEAPKPKIPAYILALERMDKLQTDQLWQTGKVKEYYTELTEILRWFIEERYQVPALEQTTDEIMLGLRHVPGLSKEYLEKIHRLLFSADLVKFAKEQPVGSENELHFEMTRAFIEQHKAEQTNDHVA